MLRKERAAASGMCETEMALCSVSTHAATSASDCFIQNGSGGHDPGARLKMRRMAAAIETIREKNRRKVFPVLFREHSRHDVFFTSI